MTLIDPRQNREQPSTHRESLPLPFVHYGGLYSTFVRFSESADSESFLCECSRIAATNNIRDTISHLGGPAPWDVSALGNLIDHRQAINQTINVPIKFSIAEDIVPYLRFQQGICHQCNQAVPSIDYGYELCFKKSSFFASRFGFYIKQWLFAQGLTGWGSQIPGVSSSTMVKPLLQIDTIEARKRIFALIMESELNLLHGWRIWS